MHLGEEISTYPKPQNIVKDTEKTDDCKDAPCPRIGTIKALVINVVW